MTELVLRIPEIDIPLSVSCGQTFRWRQVDRCSWVGLDGDHWYRVARVGDCQEVVTNASLEQARTYFGLNDPVTKFAGIESVQSQLRGLRLLRQSSPVEVLFSFLCTSNNHVVRIASMVRHLASYGNPCAALEDEHHFPNLSRLAELEEGKLRAFGFGYRAKTIPGVAAALSQVGHECLGSLPDDELRKALIAMPGIGPKLADCIMLYAFHRLSAVPIDTHLWRAYLRLFRPEETLVALTPKRYAAASKEIRSRFGDRAGEAQLFIFAAELFGPNGRGKMPE